MISKKLTSILLLGCIISQSISFCLLQFYTIPNETINFKTTNAVEIMYKNFHPKFNYFNGLWLAFTGIFIFCMIGLLEFTKKVDEIKFLIIKKIIKRILN